MEQVTRVETLGKAVSIRTNAYLDGMNLFSPTLL